MASKLTEITSKYHTFEDNQVLTEKQLNEFISYFDDQDRLSRVFLNGIGLVCGFNISRRSNKIYITPGVGVTSDGDLIQLKRNIDKSELKRLAQNAIGYSHFKVFEDASASYDPFKKVVINGPDELLTMYELLPGPAENAKPISALTGLNEMAVILYLESFAKEGDLCTAIDCDNQGVEQINRLRVLVMSKADAEFLAKGDSVFSDYNVLDAYIDLPEVAVKRVVLDEISTSKYEELKRAYYDAINHEKTLENLEKGIAQIVTNFGSVFQLGISKSVLNANLSRLKSLLNFGAYLTPFNIQYRYDFLKDLVDTYNEIKVHLLCLKEICAPDINAFPKHIMLGLLSEINTEPKQLRHSFYKSPATNNGCGKIQQTKSLVLRLFELINRFETKAGDIKITPSNKLPELGKRSIPFYYNITTNFLKSWDYCKSSRFEQTLNLSYNRSSLAPLAHIQQPLEYNIDGFDFYRIEGHQGKDYRDVLEVLDEQKRRYGLAFDVKALSVNINSENLDIDDYDCEFEDLKVMLKAWTAEQDCILAQVSNFFSGFSTKVPGANVKEAELDIKKGVSASLKSITNFSTTSNFVKAKAASLPSANTRLLYQPDSEKVLLNVVSENLITAEDTIGIEMKKAFDENKGGSASDIIVSANAKLKDKVDTDQWNADPDTKEFVITKSVELMAHTHVLTTHMPTAVSLVDTTTVGEYKFSLSQLCALVQKLKAGYQSTQLSVQLRAFMGLLINQLATVCCSGKKLEILLEEVTKRKEQILLQLQLSKFVEKHPGLEHKAGVEPGGTFVLVYKNKEVVSDKKSIIEKLAPGKMVAANTFTAATVNLSDKILNIDKLTSREKTEALKSATSLFKYDNFVGNLKRIETLERFIPVSTVPDNTVIADFALPYMCCSDCAPLNFIVAKPPATLRLKKDKYCLLTDTDPIPFVVTPTDGVVEANPAVSGIIIEDKRLVFEPADFPQEMFGKAIRFTVNSQVTDAELTVYQGIETDFEVPKEPTSEVRHTFVPSGELPDAKFLWDFGDGETSEERSPTHSYKLPVNEENKVTVTLHVTASNGVCKTTVSHDIVFNEIETSIALKPENFCNNDKNSYPFIITPSNGKAEIKGDGVNKDANGNFVFVPAAAKPGVIEFVLNGESSGYSIIVHAAPHASFVVKQEGNQLIITNTSKNASLFKWSINRSVHETDSLQPIVIDITPNSPTEWKIVLQAIGADVCPSSSASQSFQTKFIEEPPVSKCPDEIKAGILIDNKVLQGINPVDSSIVIDLLNQTKKLYDTILAKADDFIAGKANNLLQELFLNLMQQTADMVLEMNGNKEVQQQLILLFELQLRLFYNILGCQTNEQLKEFNDILDQFFKAITEIILQFKKLQVVLHNEMKEFLEAYAKRVEKLILLPTHINLVRNELI